MRCTFANGKRKYNLKTQKTMKHKNLFIIVFVSMLTVSLACHADDKPIPESQLPAAAKTFVKKQFPGKTVSYAEKDGTIFKTYEVVLNDGSKIEFDKNGNWDSVDCKTQAVPSSLVPASIREYVNTNFRDQKIVKIDKESYGYEIELSNKLELKFSKQGRLIEIDD